MVNIDITFSPSRRVKYLYIPDTFKLYVVQDTIRIVKQVSKKVKVTKLQDTLSIRVLVFTFRLF